MNKKFWQFRNKEGSNSAELMLYGDISETSWYGDEVTPAQFAQELAALGDVDEITVHIDSGGGDVFAAENIGNQLERSKATVTACVDGLCASAATIIACHADRVTASPTSFYMIHPVSIGLAGYLTADEIENALKAVEAIQDGIVSLYAKKSGRGRKECEEWMNATTWWTGAQAKENGFVDELTSEAEEAVVENRGGMLFINSVGTRLAFDEAPDFVQNQMKAVQTAPGFANNHPAAMPATNHEEAIDMDIKTVNDLRAAYPDLVEEVENSAVTSERSRIQEIEDATLPGTESVANEAKFVKPINSADFAKAVIASMKKREKEQNEHYLNSAKNAANASGANGINGTPPAKEDQGSSFLGAIHRANGVK